MVLAAQAAGPEKDDTIVHLKERLAVCSKREKLMF